MTKIPVPEKPHIETLFETGWRPFLGWVFAIIILFDFVIAPGITMLLIKAGVTMKPWVSLTLDSAGFFYLGVCSVLTMTSYGRDQVKIAREKVLGARKPYDFGKDEPKDDELGPPL